jgi:hypothetical protein
MKTIRAALLSSTAGLLAAVLPAHAHHSFPAQYDVAKPITLTGKVTKVEWTNPHIFIYIDVTDEGTGAVVETRLAENRRPHHRGGEPGARRQPAREREIDRHGSHWPTYARRLER